MEGEGDIYLSNVEARCLYAILLQDMYSDEDICVCMVRSRSLV